MMKRIKILWVEDEAKFPASVLYRIKQNIKNLGLILEDNDVQQNGKYVSDTVRDWKPDLIMMDHNLQDVTMNGANLIAQIRFQDAHTPIIFYSSEMGPELIKLIEGEDEVYTSPRGDVSDELLRILSLKFI